MFLTQYKDEGVTILLRDLVPDGGKERKDGGREGVKEGGKKRKEGCRERWRKERNEGGREEEDGEMQGEMEEGKE